jgi:hypothetical protein
MLFECNVKTKKALILKFENRIFQLFLLLVHELLIPILKNIKYLYKI